MFYKSVRLFSYVIFLFLLPIYKDLYNINRKALIILSPIPHAGRLICLFPLRKKFLIFFNLSDLFLFLYNTLSFYAGPIT